MSRYFFDLIGIDEDDVGSEFRSDGEARNAAITYLGEYLQDYPGYAIQGHWQVDVYDQDRVLLFNVVVSTVDARAARRLA